MKHTEIIPTAILNTPNCNKEAQLINCDDIILISKNPRIYAKVTKIIIKKIITDKPIKWYKLDNLCLKAFTKIKIGDEWTFIDACSDSELVDNINKENKCLEHITYTFELDCETSKTIVVDNIVIANFLPDLSVKLVKMN
jgi:hypothetical protein